MTVRLSAFLLLLVCSASLAEAQVTPSDRVRVSADVARGLLMKRVSPVYPPLARQARIQGTVILRVFLSKSGDVQNLQLVSGHPMLAPAAVEAVKQWKYDGYLLNGEPVEAETTVQVNFTLAEKPPADGVVGDSPGGDGTGNISVGSPGGQGSAFINSPRVRISEVVMRGLRTDKLYAVYPPEAEQARIQGQVVLNVQLSKSGEVASIRMISGHPMLAPSAIDAVKQWKYKPYLLNDEPVEVETMVRLSFSLPLEQSGHGLVADTPLEAKVPPTAPRIAVPQRVRVAGGVEQGLLIRKVNPLYPPYAREQHIQGAVVLRARIDKEGNIADLQLISGDPDLAAAAIDAVTQWKYRPYLLNGNPIEVETQIQVNFTLAE